MLLRVLVTFNLLLMHLRGQLGSKEQSISSARQIVSLENFVGEVSGPICYGFFYRLPLFSSLSFIFLVVQRKIEPRERMLCFVRLVY